MSAQARDALIEAVTKAVDELTEVVTVYGFTLKRNTQISPTKTVDQLRITVTRIQANEGYCGESTEPQVLVEGLARKTGARKETGVWETLPDGIADKLLGYSIDI